MDRRALPSACIALLALAAPAAADTLKVPKDFATIGEAVAAAQSGDTISVSKGTYAEQVVVAVADIKLVGKSAVIDAGFVTACLDIQADGVSVSGFTLVNGTTGLVATASNVSVSKCTVRDSASAGISITGGACTVSGNTVGSCVGNGIEYVRAATGQTLIEKNTVRMCLLDGLSVEGDDVTVSKNTCELCGGRGVIVNVLPLRAEGAPASPPVVVEKNDCNDNAVGLLALNGTASLLTISKNECSHNSDRGIIVDAIEPVVSGNTCEDNFDTGLHLLTTGAQVEKNVCSGNRRTGISVDSDVAIADGGGFGSGSDNVLSGNTCKDNGADGIRIVQGTGNNLAGNKCIGNADDGIDLDDAAIADTTLDGNTCNENGHEGIDNTGQATVIADNVCKNNGYGLGPDIAGTGDGGAGTVAAFTGNKFVTGGEASPSRLDNFHSTAP